MRTNLSARTLDVSDLDGTLLNSHGVVSSESTTILNAMIAQGVRFTFATARSFRSACRSTASLHLGLPVITYGGTITVDPSTGAPLDVRLLGADSALAVLSACEGHTNVSPILHTFENGRDWIRWRPDRTTQGTTTFLEQRREDPRLRPIGPSDPLDPATVFYVSILAAAPALAPIRRVLGEAAAGAVQFLSADDGTPGLDWLEIHHESGTKARAIERLALALGTERIVVFGDNANDLPMFAIADEAYAVSGAIPAVRAAATAIIGSHDEDAVARWIARDLDLPANESRRLPD